MRREAGGGDVEARRRRIGRRRIAARILLYRLASERSRTRSTLPSIRSRSVCLRTTLRRRDIQAGANTSFLTARRWNRKVLVRASAVFCRASSLPTSPLSPGVISFLSLRARGAFVFAPLFVAAICRRCIINCKAAELRTISTRIRRLLSSLVFTVFVVIAGGICVLFEILFLEFICADNR